MGFNLWRNRPKASPEWGNVNNFPSFQRLRTFPFISGRFWLKPDRPTGHWRQDWVEDNAAWMLPVTQDPTDRRGTGPAGAAGADGFFRIMTRWHLQNGQAIGLTDSPWPAGRMPELHHRCPPSLPRVHSQTGGGGGGEFLHGKKRGAEKCPE